MVRPRKSIRFEDVEKFIADVCGNNLHAKRIQSLAGAALGVMAGASLALSTIGHALAQAQGLVDKHAIKQVDRLLSNRGIVVEELLADWVRQVVGERKEIFVVMDWTDFDADHQATLVLSLVSNHGRATPLLWRSVFKDQLQGHRNAIEDACLEHLAQVLPEGLQVTILADRGFGDHNLYAFLDELGFDYVIRFRSNILVSTAEGERRPAAQWVGQGGRARKLCGASVTGAGQAVAAVVCVHAKDMKEPWCLVTSHGQDSASQIVKHYGRRWTIEPSFRDSKDLHFGMGLSSVRISTPERRDRLLLISAFAVALLTLLGAAGESLGMDRLLKSNTVKRRTHSLFRQGCLLFDLIPNMPEIRLRPLIERFYEFLQQSRVFSAVFSIL